jgi:hypothetical protein
MTGAKRDGHKPDYKTLEAIRLTAMKWLSEGGRGDGVVRSVSNNDLYVASQGARRQRHKWPAIAQASG